MKIKKLSKNAKLPQRAEKGSAGYDLYTPEAVVIKPGRNLVPLHIAIAIDDGYEGNIRPRSGFSLKGMEGIGSPHRLDADVIQGTIDSSYRGDVGVIIKSFEDKPFCIPGGMRIAQMVISKCYTEPFEEVDELDTTERGDGGFGHTGTK